MSFASPGMGRGSTFTVCLPRLTGDANGVVTAGDQSAGALRVMVVDDNADAASMLAMLLEAGGHTVHVEHGALAALASTASWVPDVFLLDIGLPDIDGNALAAR